MPSLPLTDDERQQIRDLHTAGHGCNAIARQLGRDRSTISRAASDMGITFDRKQTRAATQARADDNAAKRAELETLYLTEAKQLLAELRQPTIVYNFGGRDNTYNEAEHPEPDAGAKLKLMQASGAAMDRALKIAALDSDSGAEDGRGMLGALAAGLQAAYEQLGPNDES